MTVHKLSRLDARRIAVRAQLLDSPRPTELLAVVRQLTLLQIDPTAVIAPSADLVAWSRLGSSYSPAQLDTALADRTLLELRAMIRPSEDLALYRADMATWESAERGELPGWRASQRDWVRANDACRRDLLDRLSSSGPLPSREFPDTCKVPWRSTGWTNNRNVTQLLEFMVLRGEVAIAGRRGGDRLWDLASRVYPDDPLVPRDQGLRIRNERRLRALGIARARGPECPVEPVDVGEAGEPAVVEGVRGTWRVDPSQLGETFSGRAALLSPFDRLIHDRKRTVELFEFDYQLEMYKPAAKRRWGYFALPILYGDQLVGKLDATADRNAGVLRVDAIHQDVPFDRTTTAAVDVERQGGHIAGVPGERSADQLGGGRPPELHPPLVAHGAGEQVSVRPERQGGYPIGAGEGLTDRLSGGRPPQAHGPVVAGAGQQVPLGAERYRRDLPGVPGQGLAGRLTGGRVPQAHGLVTAGAGQ